MRKVAILGADIFEGRRELTLFHSAEMEAAYYTCKDPLELADTLADVDGLIVNLERVSGELLSRLGRLKVIGRYGVGVDNIDLQAASEKLVAVINVPDYCIDEVAEHAISFIFAANRKLFASSALTRNGEWGNVQELKPIRPMKDVTLGVVGTGRIGMKVIRSMALFGANIIVYDPYMKQEDMPDHVRLVEFQELLKVSDVITIHCPLTEQTRHMFNSDTFGFMERQPALVNVSRGAIICERDLLQALESGAVSSAFLDVLESEPPAPDHPLLHHPKAIVTNHIAWYSVQAEAKLRDLVATRVIDYLNGKPVPTVVNQAHLQRG